MDSNNGPGSSSNKSSSLKEASISTGTGSKYVDTAFQFMETNRSQLPGEIGKKCEATIWRQDHENKQFDAQAMGKTAQVAELLDQLKKMDISEAAQQDVVFEQCYRPVLEKEKEIRKLEKELEELRRRNRNRTSTCKDPVMTEIVLMDKDTRTPKPFKLVDFAAMSTVDVWDYDGRYGGEEALRVKERQVMALAKEQQRAAEGWDEDARRLK